MIELALVGCGKMAHWHAQQLQKIEACKVVALVDPMAGQTREFKEKYFHDAAQYDSIENLLSIKPPKLAGVVLVTPHTLHFPQAKLALENNLHVLVEKPMVTRSEACVRALAARKKDPARNSASLFNPPTQ
jgi:UDP-N-acetyl-2-amino-2-deoxyglucuronate dehydrogenase